MERLIFAAVNDTDVFVELSTLNPHKACGPNQICRRLLKEGAEIIASPLAELFNKSLSDGMLPQDWVSANITPILKRGINSRYQITDLLVLLAFYAKFLKG